MHLNSHDKCLTKSFVYSSTFKMYIWNIYIETSHCHQSWKFIKTKFDFKEIEEKHRSACVAYHLSLSFVFFRILSLVGL